MANPDSGAGDANGEANARRVRRRDRMATLASGFVGALALATSTYNVYLQRQQVRAQVWPRLVVHTDYENDVFSVAVINRGVGPAEIKRVRVTVDGEPAVDWFDAERRLLRRNDFDMLHVSIEPIEGQVVSPGLAQSTFLVAQADDARAMFNGARRLATEICYCSTLGECWVYREASAFEPSVTMAVGECKDDPRPFRAATAETMAGLQERFEERAQARRDAGGDAQ